MVTILLGVVQRTVFALFMLVTPLTDSDKASEFYTVCSTFILKCTFDALLVLAIADDIQEKVGERPSRGVNSEAT